MLKAILFDIDGVLVDTITTNAAFYQNFGSEPHFLYQHYFS